MDVAFSVQPGADALERGHVAWLTQLIEMGAPGFLKQVYSFGLRHPTTLKRKFGGSGVMMTISNGGFFGRRSTADLCPGGYTILQVEQ